MSFSIWWRGAAPTTEFKIVRYVLILIGLRVIAPYCGIDRLTTMDVTHASITGASMILSALVVGILMARAWAGRRPAVLDHRMSRSWIAGALLTGFIAAVAAWCVGALLGIVAQYCGGKVEVVSATVVSSRHTSTPRTACKRTLVFQPDTSDESSSFCIAAPWHPFQLSAPLNPEDRINIATRTNAFGRVAMRVYPE